MNRERAGDPAYLVAEVIEVAGRVGYVAKDQRRDDAANGKCDSDGERKSEFAGSRKVVVGRLLCCN